MTTRQTNFTALALTHVLSLSEPPPLPPPPAVPSCPTTGRSVEFEEAADAAAHVLRQAQQTLASTLSEEQLSYLSAIIQAARQLGTCRERAQVRRKSNTQLQGTEARLRHVAVRLKEHFGWVISLEELQDLRRTWQAAPAAQALPGCIVRQVTFRDRVIYPLYEVQPSGAQHLTTVLKEAPLD